VVIEHERHASPNSHIPMIPKRWPLLISITTNAFVLAPTVRDSLWKNDDHDDEEKEMERRSFMFCLTSCIINKHQSRASFILSFTTGCCFITMSLFFFVL